MTYQEQLEQRREELRNLKERSEELEIKDEHVQHRIDTLLRKMARMIDKNNYKLYSKEAKTLLEAQDIIQD
jgi:CII-binding regulator of phage lambda lysogenization HflD